MVAQWIAVLRRIDINAITTTGMCVLRDGGAEAGLSRFFLMSPVADK